MSNLFDRYEFLQHGVVDYDNTSEERCSICMEENPTLSRLVLCSHIFCRECITTWARGGPRQSCPMCRLPLWMVDDPIPINTAPANQLTDLERAELMVRAPEYLPIQYFSVRDARDILPNLLNEIIGDALFLAADVILQQDDTLEENMAQLDAEIGVAVTATMGNLLQWYFTQHQGHPLTLPERRQWHQLLQILMRLLTTDLDGRRRPRSTFPSWIEFEVFQQARDLGVSGEEVVTRLSDSDWFTQPEDYDASEGELPEVPDADALFRRWMFEQVLRHVARTAPDAEGSS